LKDDVKDNIKIISKELWTYFFQQYGGGPEIKRSIIDHDDFDIFYYKIKFKVILKLDDGLQAQAGLPIKIYISRFKTIMDLYLYIYELVHGEIKFSENIFIRLWKYNDGGNYSSFDKFVEQNKPLIENSKQLDFPGTLFDSI
jgi:hypothetical protein